MSLSFTPKKGKYSVAGSEEDGHPEKVTRRPMPVRNGQGHLDDDSRLMDRPPTGAGYTGMNEKITPKKKKGKKKKQVDDDEAMEMQSVYENQIASLQDSPTSDVPQVDLRITGPPTVEMEEDLLQNAEEERRKNKQRLREKKRKEHDSPLKRPGDNDVDVAYESAQKEIDRVLGPRNDLQKTSGEKPKKKSKDKQKKKKDKEEEREDSQSEGNQDSLEEARLKIHRLLDDAFSLISQSRSSMGNKVHPISQQSSMDKESPRSRGSRSSHSPVGSARDEPKSHPVNDPVYEKKHTPVEVERSLADYDRSGLITWSPYRASDETAMISMPRPQTKISVVAPQTEPITGTTVFSESLPSSLQQPNYYTTLPGEPIVLKTKHLDPNSPNAAQPQHHHHPPTNFNINSSPQQKHQQQYQNGHQSHHHNNNGHPSHPNTATTNNKPDNQNYYNYNYSHPQQPTPNPSDQYYTPYYGMSSYQDLPMSNINHSVPNHHQSSTEDDNDNDNTNTTTGYHDQYNHHTNTNNNPRSSSDSVLSHTHTRPGGRNGHDEMDVIKNSIQPGVSPQPLIHSLREELMNLSSRKGGQLVNGNQSAGVKVNYNESSLSSVRKSSHTSSSDKPPRAPVASSGQDLHRNGRNSYMKTDL